MILKLQRWLGVGKALLSLLILKQIPWFQPGFSCLSRKFVRGFWQPFSCTFVRFRALSCALAFVGFAGAERPISLDFSIFAKIVVMEVVSSPIMANHAGKQ